MIMKIFGTVEIQKNNKFDWKDTENCWYWNFFDVKFI